MNDDLEPRLHDALHYGALPPAPASLIDALERVPDAPVRLRRRRGGGPILGLFAAAAVLLVASAVALTGGAAPKPGPTAHASPPSVAAGSPRLHLEYTAQTVDGVAPTPADMAKVASILRSRIDAMGVADPTVTTHDLVLVVELPGVTDAADVETVGRMLGHTGQVEFVPLGDTPVGVGDPIDLTKDPPLFGGDQIASATVAADQTGAPAVDFLLKPDGTRLFADYTANHVGSYFAITMDGDVLSAPVIQNAIPNGDIEISGGDVSGLDAMHAHGLVALIGSGKLPVPLVLTSSSLIGLASPAASTP
jgi:preprotein translocase subunit SecD